MIMERRRGRCRRYCAFTCKHSIKLISAVLLPLLLAIFTVVITFEQRKDSELQRQQDLNISLQARKQDMDIARLHRESDEKKREQDLNISLLAREHDKAIANEKRLADNLNAEKQRNMSRELEEIRYEQEREKYFDALLLSYMNDIGQLLKENNGSLASNPTVGALARAKTLQVIRPIGRIRGAQLVYFMYDAGQLTRDKIPLGLSGAHFDNMQFALDLPLHYISFVGTYLNNASFAGQDLSGADFHGAHLTGANFSRTNCTNVIFDGATMIDTDFSYAIMSFSSFIDVQLNASKFTYTNCTNAIFNRAIMVDVDCSYCDLTSAAFHSVDFTRGIFYSAYGNYTSFSQVKMQMSNFINSFFSKCNFVESILTSSDFRNSSLSHVYFEYCDIENADFTGAYIQRTIMNRTSLAFSTLINASLPGTHFSQSDLSYANLSGSCCSVCREHERCGVGCVWMYRKTLSKLNTVMCDGSVHKEPPLIRNGQVSCNNASSLKDDWDEVSDPEPIILKLNDSDMCVLGPVSGANIFFVSAKVNISDFEDFIQTGDAVATVRARMSRSIQIYIQNFPLTFQFHRAITQYTLIQSKSFRIPSGTTELSILIEIWIRMDIVPPRFNYIELAIAPRPPKL